MHGPLWLAGYISEHAVYKPRSSSSATRLLLLRMQSASHLAYLPTTAILSHPSLHHHLDLVDERGMGGNMQIAEGRAWIKSFRHLDDLQQEPRVGPCKHDTVKCTWWLIG
jgi:hypothetical protein